MNEKGNKIDTNETQWMKIKTKWIKNKNKSMKIKQN